MKFLLLIWTTFIVLVACNTQPAEPEDKAGPADSLFEAVMEGHDVVMPKMNKLERLQRETKAAIDSVAKLPAAKRAALAAHKNVLDSTLRALDYGNAAMTDWMNGFKYDSFKNNEPERIRYLQSELEKVNKMKNAVLKGLAMADSVLAK